MPQLPPTFLSDASVAAAYVIFLASYLVFALGKFPGLKIDRPGAAIIGAVAMVAFRIVPARGALGMIDFPAICAGVFNDGNCRQSALVRLFRVDGGTSLETFAS
jgi:hypothetical protein